MFLGQLRVKRLASLFDIESINYETLNHGFNPLSLGLYEEYNYSLFSQLALYIKKLNTSSHFCVAPP